MIHGIRDGVYAQALVPNFLVADTISRTLCANRLADYTLIKMSDNEVIQAVTVLRTIQQEARMQSLACIK